MKKIKIDKENERKILKNLKKNDGHEGGGAIKCCKNFKWLFQTKKF